MSAQDIVQIITALAAAISAVISALNRGKLKAVHRAVKDQAPKPAAAVGTVPMTITLDSKAVAEGMVRFAQRQSSTSTTPTPTPTPAATEGVPMTTTAYVLIVSSPDASGPGTNPVDVYGPGDKAALEGAGHLLCDGSSGWEFIVIPEASWKAISSLPLKPPKFDSA